jgi:hypothetical protein
MAESVKQYSGRGRTERVYVTNEVAINDGGNNITVDGNVGTWEVQPSGAAQREL